MTKMKRAWLLGAALTMMVAPSAMAQDSDASGERDAPVSSSDIVVPGEVVYRNRSDETAPVLEYGADYFQRFEPLTVGDALKRVPSVAFLSDVLESDGVRLRGLDPAYTQILINGEQVPGAGDSSGAFGSGADGAFFVDRIPAELIERVEIVRSQSANRSGDAVAGAINIVLRDSYALNGGYIRAGVLHWANDENWGETLGGVWGGEALGGRLLLGANMQDRHNPKDKLSTRFDDPADTSINDVEVQTDVRDGTDYSANFSYQADVFNGGEFELNGFYVHTDRYQDEDSIEYDDGIIDPTEITSINSNDVDIEQDSWSLNTGLELPMFGGETRFKFGYASFEDQTFEFENEVSYDSFDTAEEIELDTYDTGIEDEEFKFKIEQEWDFDGAAVEIGVHFEDRERVQTIVHRDFDDDGFSLVIPDASLATIVGVYGPIALSTNTDDDADNTIERTRIDPYVMFSGEAGAIEWEAGMRLEITETTTTDRADGGTVVETTTEIPLPSAHVTWNVTDNDRILASVARSVRYPSFSFLSPAVIIEALEDHDFVGNPALEPETAWGFDLGYERRFGRTGVAGINFFYRDVTDLIEVYTVPPPAVSDSGEELLSARNIGDGEVWGVEIDLSAPLTIIGLPNTGVFLNYSWLDSETTDEFGTRTFNSQADSVLNVGFIHDIPSWNSSFGVTYRDQGEAFSRVVTEEVTTEYGGDLELFVEHRLGENFTIRLTGSNLLDESKDEVFDKFDNLSDQLARNYDEYEIETESAGPVYQVVGRLAF